MSEIDFAGEARKWLDQGPHTRDEWEADLADFLRSIAQRVQEEAAKIPNRPCAEICQQNRAEGRGPCGACALCCKEQTVRAEIAEAREDALRFADRAAIQAERESEIRADERAKVEAEWKQTLDEANIVHWTYRKEHEGDPRLALNDLLACAIRWACDPAISEPAAKLVADAREDERQKWAERMDVAASVHEFKELAPYRASYVRVWAKRLRENSDG